MSSGMLKPGALQKRNFNPQSQSSQRTARVTMPSRDSLGSVDPDDVQVAEVDTLLVHQGGTGATLGPSVSPWCAGRGALPFILSSGAELCSQDSCEEKQRVDMGLSSAVPSTCIIVFRPDLAAQIEADKAYSRL